MDVILYVTFIGDILRDTAYVVVIILCGYYKVLIQL